MRNRIMKLALFLVAVVAPQYIAAYIPLMSNPIESTKCYGQFGCFSSGGDFFHPTIRPLSILPQDPESIGIRYLLFTRKNPTNAYQLKFQDKSSVKGSNFDSTKKTVILTHGFLGNGEKIWLEEIRQNYLTKDDMNVIQLDWGGGSKTLFSQATANTRIIGVHAALMIEFLEENAGAKRGNFHFIGHSLGAHIAGYCGERLKGKLGRITGLDAAGPYFENTAPVVRLDPTDALFVDAIHTDSNHVAGAIILDGGFGIKQPVGHVDFYPNGGEYQPDCSKNPIDHIKIHGIIQGTGWLVTCHHRRAYQYFADSILSENCRYKSYPCDNYENFKDAKCTSCDEGGCASMGHYATQWQRNGRKNVRMFLDTNGKAPYCGHPYFVTIDIGDGEKASDSVNGNLFIVLHGDKSSSHAIQYFSSATGIQKNTTYKRYFSIQDLGVIKRVTFYWQYSKSITDPGGLIWHRFVYLNGISVKSGNENKRSNFCAERGNALKSEETETVNENC